MDFPGISQFCYKCHDDWIYIPLAKRDIRRVSNIFMFKRERPSWVRGTKVYGSYQQLAVYTRIYPSLQRNVHITKTRLFKCMYKDNFTSKTRKFSDKKLWYFSYLCSNIDCGYSLEPPRRGGSNENPQSMFLSRNMKNNVYPCKPQFYYIKVGFKGVKII